MKIGDKKVDKWRRSELVVKENLLAEDELKQALADLPPAAGSGLPGSFPFGSQGLDQVALHPEFLSLAERALQTDRPLLVRSDVLTVAGAEPGPFRSAWEDLDLVVPPPADPAHGLVVTLVPYTDLGEGTATVEVLPVAEADRPDPPEVVTAPSGSAVVLRGDVRYRLRTGADGVAPIVQLSVFCAGDRLDVPRGHHLRRSDATTAFLGRATREPLAAAGFPLDSRHWPEDGVDALAPQVCN
jgi:hypothetical protein